MTFAPKRFDNRLKRFRALMFALSLTLFAVATQAQQPSTSINPQATPSPTPTPLQQNSAEPRRIHATRATDTIKIDGTLDEPSWSLAQPATEFLQQQPNEGAPASERTEVRVLFDDKNIYFGIRAFDSDAKHINARDLVRDSNFPNDDKIEILLDTYHDRRNAFRFAVNPLGTQQDALITDEGRDVNVSWNGSWISEGRIDAKGYIVEIAIPLTTLRFTEGIEAWGFNVSRVIRRKNEENLWTSWQRSFGLERVSQAGELSGVEDIRRRRLREIKPNASGEWREGEPLIGRNGLDVGGLRPRSNSISIDGLDNTDETTGAARVALSPEIVREFQIVNSGLSAEFGGAAGGAINVITRVGQNKFHGDAFTFLQNEFFNAREPYFDPPPASRLRFRRVQPGVALGGPIKRDRLFFYFAAEQEHVSAEDESEINRDAGTRINSLLTSGFAPHLSVRSLTGNPFRIGSDETEAAGKLTYTPGSRHTFNFGFAFTNARVRGEAFNTDVLTDISARGSAYTKDYQLTGSDVSVLSSHAVNDLRGQVSTRHVLTRAGDTSGPAVEVAGIARFGRPYNADSVRRETRQEIVDTVSLDRSRSQWKAGASINHVSLDNDTRDGFAGLFVFRTLDDFAAGRPAMWRQAFGVSRTQFGVTSFGGFIQDQWRATSQLTLNLGARYDVEKLPATFRTDKNNFSPRVGLAWSPSKDWVVRGGFGLFHDRLPLAFLNQAIQKNGVQSFEQVLTDGNAAAVFALTSGGRALTPFTGIAPSIFRADPKFVTPYSLQANAGVERLLSKDVTVRA